MYGTSASLSPHSRYRGGGVEDLEEELHSLSRLKIENCPNLTDFIRGVASLRRLRCLVMSKCGVENLPKRLESCEELVISNCPNLRGDCWGDLHSLTKLEIENCPSFHLGCCSLRRLVVSSCGVEDLPKRLELCEELIISNCRNLRGGYWGDLRSLTKLEIEKCPNLKSFATIHGAASLRRLVVSSCGVKSLPAALRSRTSLKELEILDCPKLIDLRGLLSLTELSIKNCPQLRCTSESLPDGLKTLVISPFCEELQSFPTFISYARFQHSLERLELCGWAILNSLPEEIQRFTAIRFLCINKCDGILALPEWLGNLFSLRSLTVDNCEKLEYFPTAEAMGSLTELEICDCPALQERCAEYTGTEWFKIAHIPIIQINGEYIRWREGIKTNDW
uniref:NB-ARC domain-containing protein n=1 Tax=Fagus sylvatica TaxID=28930 RepID=A0A2N9II55_FAGSY